MDLKLKNNSQLSIPIYNQVEYVESSGVVNIDTGVSIVMNRSYHSIKATIEVVENNGTNSMIFSAHTNGVPTDTGRCAFNLFCNGTSVDSFKVQAIYPYNTNLPEVSFSGKTTIEQGKGYITINGVRTTVSTSSSNHTFNLFLLKGNVKVRIWNFQVLYNGEPIRNYIPVKSLESGHIGEACLYDTVNNIYKYSSSTGSFTASPSQGLYDVITSAYIKDCPNVSGINILRSYINLNRVRLDIGNQSGTVAELYKYAAYAGFNDAYEQQIKPRLVGTWTISDYWTNDELSYLQSAFDGLTINIDSSKNVDTLLENGDMAIQTLDSTKDGYNPAAAIALNNSNIGFVTTFPIINGKGRYFLTKNDAAIITSIGTAFNNATTLIDQNSIVTTDDTEEYNFTTLDEFKYFTGITTLDNGIRSTSLTSITMPQGVNVNLTTFNGSTSISNLHVKGNVANISTGSAAFAYDGTILIDGSATVSGTTTSRFLHYIIKGDFNLTTNQRYFIHTTNANIVSFRVNGIFKFSSGNFCKSGGSNLKFLEFMGSITNLNEAIINRASPTNCVMHLGQSTLAYSSPTNLSSGKVTKIYVGNGTSRANDEAVLALYLADTNWSAQSAKLGTWYDYNGEYKWYYITDNLTDCTNTNPDAWPHITRGEEYRTTIVADEGYTLDTVKVEMYSARDNSLTPDEPTDITSAVYDASTGEIYIQEVVGNVIITASAS